MYLAERCGPSFWYSVGERDSDPHLFVMHLIWALRTVHPTVGGQALAILEGDHDPAARRSAIDSLANDMLDPVSEDSVFVVDDYHLAAKNPEVNEVVERFVNTMPPKLHVVLSTRKKPSLGSLARWRVKGEVLELSERDLAFASDEIHDLFLGPYNWKLTAEQVSTLCEHTEGWIIALEMIWHALREGATLRDLWTRPPRSLQGIFEYLAAEVLFKQEDHVQEFLSTVSLLDELDPEACDYVSGRSDSRGILEQLATSGLFVYTTACGTYRLHYLLREFLRRICRKDAARWIAGNSKAARFFADNGQHSLAVSHLMAAGDYDGAARALSGIAPDLVRSGRFDALAAWISELPGSVLEAYPDLLLRRADVYRLTSNYDDALAWYTMAEEVFVRRSDPGGRSRSVKGKAMVYLDTVQPARSEALLKEAFRLLPPDDQWERATLLRMMAENKANQGQSQIAMKLARAAERLIHQATEDELDIRVHLRTGRLSAALASLKRKEGEEREGSRPPRSHRETQLLLSLVYALVGEGSMAAKCARAGIELGRDLKAPFVEAVGYMRLGHARQLTPAADGLDAGACYRKALDIADELKVVRGRAEPLMGLALLHAASGEVTPAERDAAEALEICGAAGDEWLAGFVQLAMGAGLASAGNDDKASPWLDTAKKTFARCGDVYCGTVCELWLAVLAHRKQEEPRLRERLGCLLRAVRTHSYEFLFTRKTLFGPRDLGVLAPLLVEARRLGLDEDHVAWLQAATGFPKVEFHPGYTLHIRALGPFRLYRGREEVSPREWQREKAKSLFQLLLVNRKGYLHKDQILDILWPGLDPDVAAAHFKVVQNSMLRVVEPARPARLSPFFLNREGSLCALNPGSGYWLDADEFESLVAKGMKLATSDAEGACDVFRSAIELYLGDFLQECLYEDWAMGERERLVTMYLRGAHKFAEILLAENEIDECISVCDRILAKDPCWEEAYRLLMLCYFTRRNRAMVVRTYERCAAALRTEMGVEPARETLSLFERAKLVTAL